MALKLRIADLSDDRERRFILDAWLKSFKKSHYSGIIANNRFADVTTDVILQLIERGAHLLLLEETTVGSYIGFVCYEDATVPILHYIYLKPLLRQQSLAKKMLLSIGITKQSPWVYTFRTRMSNRLIGGIFCKALACSKTLEPILSKQLKPRRTESSRRNVHQET